MSRRSRDQGIRAEVFLSAANGDNPADEPALGGGHNEDTAEDHVRASVWDEPAAKVAGLRAPPGAETYAAWYVRLREETSVARAVQVTVLLALAGGPFSILGALFTGGAAPAGMGLLFVVVVAPIVEEMLKAGATLITLERKPYLFKSSWQILTAVALSGLCFSVLENLIYLNIYIPDPSPSLVIWRWTVCTALHVGCSTIAALGLIRMYREASQRLAPPRVALAYPLLIAAMVVHGAYNFSAIFLQFFVTTL